MVLVRRRTRSADDCRSLECGAPFEFIQQLRLADTGFTVEHDGVAGMLPIHAKLAEQSLEFHRSSDERHASPRTTNVGNVLRDAPRQCCSRKPQLSVRLADRSVVLREDAKRCELRSGKRA